MSEVVRRQGFNAGSFTGRMPDPPAPVLVVVPGPRPSVDGDTREVRLTFADDAATGLAMGAATDEAVRERMEIARDGALAFRRWADALLVTYLEVDGHTLGEPIVTIK